MQLFSIETLVMTCNFRNSLNEFKYQHKNRWKNDFVKGENFNKLLSKFEIRFENFNF